MSDRKTAAFVKRNLRYRGKGSFNPDSSFIAVKTDEFLERDGKITRLEASGKKNYMVSIWEKSFRGKDEN